MHYQNLSLLLAAAHAVTVSSQPLEARQDDATTTDVRLYAFGDSKSGIGGFPVSYIDGGYSFPQKYTLMMMNGLANNMLHQAFVSIGGLTPLLSIATTTRRANSQTGLAYIASKPTESANSSARFVTFNTQTTGQLVATVNDASNNTAVNSTYLLYVPSTSGPMGFATTEEAGHNSTELTDKFGMYGQMLYVASDSGEITTKWYAVLSSESSSANVTTWQLNWNLSADEVAAGGDNIVPVAMRTAQPVQVGDEE